MRFILIFLCLVFAHDLFPQSEINAAAKNGDFTTVVSLLDKGVDINERDAENYTPLLSAYFNSHDSLAMYLINRGASLNVENNYGWTILMTAAEKDSIPILEFLLEKGAEINYISRSGYTALDQTFPGKARDFLLSKGALAGFDILNKGETRFKKDEKGKQGYWEVREFDGTIIGKGKYKNDQKTGKWKYYNAEGLIDSEGGFKEGYKHGVWKSYLYMDGEKLVNIEVYKNGIYAHVIKMEW